MTSFTDRERGFEAKYSLDLEQNFRFEAHLGKMLALWAGERMGQTPDQARDYAAQVVGQMISDPGENSIAAILMADFARKGIDISVGEVTRMHATLRQQALAEVAGAQS